MQLIVNGQNKDIQATHVMGLIKELEIEGTHIAVAVNMQIIPRAQFESTRLKEGDKIEIVHAVGGG